MRAKSQYLNKYSYKSVFVTLLLVCWVSFSLNVEANLNFPGLFILTTIGYTLFNLAKQKYRSVILALLGFAGICLVLNPINTVLLYLIGGAFFLIADTSITKRNKVFLLISFALALALLRSQFNLAFIDQRFWVILASIFIFRTIIYVKEKDLIKSSPSKLDRFNYFFLFPNVFSPLFPIIDYKDFTKEVQTQDTGKIRLKGINLITTGLIQLLIYRLLYTYLLPPVSHVENTSTLIQYVIINYLLVFRLMGMLNICVGTLRIFNLNLPEIFNNIFIATGVSDFFRRLNIYWKEFLLNYFYYPLYFKIRKLGMMKALAISAIATFILNWFFHAYQWFWILGSSSIRWTDTIFWFLFSVIAIGEMLFQARNKRQVVSKNKFHFLWPLKVILTFTFIATIWSLWTSPSVNYWINLYQNCFAKNNIPISYFISLFLITYVTLYLYKKYVNNFIEDLYEKKLSLLFKINFVILVILTIISSATLIEHSNNDAILKINKFAVGKINNDDSNDLAEGYYDGLLEFNIGSANWDIGLVNDVQKEKTGKIHKYKTKLNDLRLWHYLPNQNFELNGKNIITNNFGLRGKNYSTLPDTNTIRVAFFGGSPEAGLTLSNKETLTAIVEEKINTELLSSEKKFELFNYTKSGYTTSNYLSVLKLDALKVKPQYAIFTIRTREFNNSFRRLSKTIIKEKPLLDKDFQEFLNNNQIEFREKISKAEGITNGRKIWYRNTSRLIEICRENNVTPVMLFIPQLVTNNTIESNHDEMKIYLENSDVRFIDLEGIFDNYKTVELNISENNTGNHPNAKAHRIISEHLSEKLKLLIQDEIKN